ncbi:MAG: hypothetical protein ABFD83_09870 [Armatimonadota bacterium]
MKAQVYYLLGIVIIGYGLRIISKGYAAKSKPRMLLGLAIVPVGVSQFFRTISWLATSLILLGVVIFVASLFLLRKESRRIR